MTPTDSQGENAMALLLKKQRDGRLRDHWYGMYHEGGKRKIVNLGVKWRGTPHPSLKISMPGDRAFEESRAKALAELEKYTEEIRHKGLAEHIAERLIESKTGRSVEYVTLGELSKRWRKMGRESNPSERHLANCDSHLERFVTFIGKNDPAIKRLYEVNERHAADYVDFCRKTLAPSTARTSIRMIRQAMGRFLPVGAANPFANIVNRRTKSGSGIIHRKPFTPEELKKLLDAAQGDDFLQPLLVCAAMTGMRLGDVCKLKWSAVDLEAGMIALKTSKTEKEVEIPIFKPLHDVFSKMKTKGDGLVFPAAEEMHRKNPDGLTWRFKKLIVVALSDGKKEKRIEGLQDAADIKDEVLKLIIKKVPEGRRRKRMIDVIESYAGGRSVKQIEHLHGYARSLISGDLAWMERETGKKFVRRKLTGTEMAEEVAKMTTVERKQGKKAASVRDWHALRATFVTLALSAGVPIELVKRITGHATVDVVLTHYFRPGRAEFRSALVQALPMIITGGEEANPTTTKLDELLLKIKNRTATEKDKQEFRLLAAKV